MEDYSKYPRQLSENSHKKVPDQVAAAICNHASIKAFNQAQSYQFDGLTNALSNPQIVNGIHTSYFDPDHQQLVPWIERQDDPNELYYRSVFRIEDWFKLCLGDKKMHQRKDLMDAIYKIIRNPDKAMCIFRKNPDGSYLSDITAPVRISLQAETGKTMTSTELQRFANLEKNPLAPIGGYKGCVAYITIEYHKWLFQDIIKQNSDGTIGVNYFKVTPYFQAKLKDAVDAIKDGDFFAKYKGGRLNSIQVPLWAEDVRNFYFYILEHDNNFIEKIELDYIDLCENCFPQALNRNERKDGTINVSIPKSRGAALRNKIEKCIVTLKILASQGDMDGALLLPYDLDPDRVSYDDEREKITIKIIRPNTKLKYDKDAIAADLNAIEYDGDF